MRFTLKGSQTLELVLDPGTHQYKFVVDGAWIADPGHDHTVDDGFGGVNSVVSVPDCGAIVLTASSSVGDTFEAHFVSPDGADLDPSSISVTLDWAPVSGLVVDGPNATLVLDGLADGIHDVRVVHGGGTMLLKVYTGLEPDWRDVVIYFAMTDRFANGDPGNDAPLDGVDWRTNYQGGDFAGITQKLEDGYFSELGVGALWISWPVDNPGYAEDGSHPAQTYCGMNPATAPTAPMKYTAYHGYWPSDVDAVEERFGTEAELRALVNAAHARNIRVLLDFTANHVHDSSWLYAEHGDWFNTPAEICQDVGWDAKPKTCWFTPYLPDFDYTSAAARDAVVDHAVDWVKRTGADGFRFDAVKHLEMSFVQQLRARTSAEFEQTGVDFYIVGETFTGDAGLIKSFVGPDKIHGQFDFPANLSILNGFATETTGLDAMDSQVRQVRALYGGGELMSTFVGNHDIARFVSLAAGQIPCGPWDVVSNIAQGWHAPPGPPGDAAPYQKLQLALTYAMTIPGLPLIYYGDEMGLPGAGDPDNRRMMRFGADLSAAEQSTLDFVKSLGQARQNHPSLRRGAWSAPLWKDGTLLAYARTTDDEAAIVVLNRDGQPRTVTIDVSGVAGDGATTEALYGGEGAIANGQLTVDLPARSARIHVIAK